MGLTVHFEEGKRFFFLNMKKNQTCYKRAFFLLFLQKKIIKIFGQIFLKFFERFITYKKIMIYIGYWLVNFLDPTNILNFH